MKRFLLPLFAVVVSFALVDCKGDVELTAENVEFEEFSTSRFPEYDANLAVSIYFKLPKQNVGAGIDSIYRDLVRGYVGDSDREIQSGIEIFADSIEADYYQMKLEMPASLSFLSVEYYDSTYPVYTKGDILEYSNCLYVDEGGAHGSYHSAYKAYSISTGRILSENDIFDMTEKNEKAIIAELIADFKRGYDDVDLWCTEDDFLNGNFMIADDGVYYQYEPMDLAPDYVGAPRLRLSKEFLKPYVRKDGPLYGCWYEKK